MPLEILLVLAWTLLLVSPILVSAFLAIFRGGGVPGRWLFIAVGPVLAYTILWVLTLVFIAPATFIVIWLAPATKELYDQLPYWYSLAEFFVKHDKLIAAAACALLSSWLVAYVWPRWSDLMTVLTSPPKPPPKS